MEIPRLPEAENVSEKIRLLEEENAALKKQIKQLQQENEIANENAYAIRAGLLRIMKERSNADRNLRPKKERSGYIVIKSFEYGHGWRTVVQSYFPANMEYSAVKKLILEDFEEWGPTANIPIDSQILFSQNLVSKYWEFTICHENPAKFPDDMIIKKINK
jgi:hypothetical protein